MVITLSAARILMLLQAVPAQTVAARRDEPRPAPAADSVRVLRGARKAQELFEYIRKQYLPREYGVGNHRCDVRVGRWCVWNDETNRKAPPEAPRVIEARGRLLAVLDTVASRFPGDEWVAAQEVRYLIEAKRYADAVHAAERCAASGSVYRCRAYAAVALHDSGAVRAADSAFTAALSAMPDSVRCRFTDISVLLEDQLADRYDHADCAGRARIERTFWNLTTPLYLRDHDFRNEYLARVTRTEMLRHSRTPMGSTTESAFRETALRYGLDTWFTRDDPPAGSMGEASIAGHSENGPGFNFVPATEVFSSPDSLTLDDWDLKRRSAQAIYAPRYAHQFLRLEHQQVALFRRGDSALVMVTYDAGDDTLFARPPLEVGLFTVPVDSTGVGTAHGTVRDHAPVRGVLTTMAPWRPMLVSIEVLDSATQTAARARFGVHPASVADRPSASVGDPLSVSDLLIFAPLSADSALPRKLADVLPLALHDLRVPSTRPLGLFWETYGVKPEGESFAISLTIERIKEGWGRRAAERLHLRTPFSPMKVHWPVMPGGGDGFATQAVLLDLARLEPGRYEIQLTLTPAHEPPVSARREIVVTR